MVQLGSGAEVIKPVPNCNQHHKLIFSALRSHSNQPDEDMLDGVK